MLTYVATQYSQAPWVELVLRPMLERAGCTICSTWHLPPHAAEDLEAMSVDEMHAAAAGNDRDLARAQAVIVIATDAGGEHLAEARVAWSAGIPIVWTGRKILSAYRPGVVRAASVAMAVEVLADLRVREWPKGAAS